MQSQCIEMTEDEFDDRFKLRPNHLNDHASWCVGDSGGCLFETFGVELDFVRSQDTRTVWTLIESESETLLVNGFWTVNRLGYLLSSDPWPEEAEIVIRLRRIS